MNSNVFDPVLIGIDWGTSSLRGFLIDANGAVLESAATPQGIMQVKAHDFEAVLHRLISPWRQEPSLPIILSGMITSRNGWLETPYLPLPVGVSELVGALTPFTTTHGERLYFVTGVTTEHNGAPDVMRGEETQAIGAVATGVTDGVFVMPGTHSKWVSVADGRIMDYTTCMTGEVFAALRAHTILGALMLEAPFHEEGFRLGVKAGLSAGNRLLHTLFHVRTLPLFDKISKESAADYLSGMLIGAEIGAMGNRETHGGEVSIIARGDLAQRYKIALDVAGFKAKKMPDNLVACGHFWIAKSAGLL